MIKKHLSIILMGLLCVGTLLTGCGDSTEQPSEAEVLETTEATTVTAAGTEATQSETAQPQEEPYVLTFEATTTDGQAFTSDCFADSKLIMINVWATYCNPCLSEMPDLGEIAASYDTADFQMIGIVSDVADNASKEDIAAAQELIVETKAEYPHLLLSESLYYNLVGGIDAVPTTFFVNQKGELLGYLTGAQSKEAWEGLINDLLAEIE